MDFEEILRMVGRDFAPAMHYEFNLDDWPGQNDSWPPMPEDQVTGHVSVLNGGWKGVYTRSLTSEDDQVENVAKQVQEIVEEQQWAAGKSVGWPACPESQHVHHLVVKGTDDGVYWFCQSQNKRIAEVGHLRQEDQLR